MLIPQSDGPVNVLCGKGAFDNFISDYRIRAEINECNDDHINEYQKKKYCTDTEIMAFRKLSDVVGIVICHVLKTSLNKLNAPDEDDLLPGPKKAEILKEIDRNLLVCLKLCGELASLERY